MYSFTITLLFPLLTSITYVDEHEARLSLSYIIPIFSLPPGQCRQQTSDYIYYNHLLKSSSCDLRESLTGLCHYQAIPCAFPFFKECSVYTQYVHYTLYREHCIVCSVHCKLYNIQCALCTVECRVQCTLYIVQYAL